MDKSIREKEFTTVTKAQPWYNAEGPDGVRFWLVQAGALTLENHLQHIERGVQDNRLEL